MTGPSPAAFDWWQRRAPWQSGTREALVAVGLEPAWVRDLVLRALEEDLGRPVQPSGRGPHRISAGHDITTEATVTPDAEGTAHVVARGSGVVAGLPLLPVVLAESAAVLGQPVPFADLVNGDGDRVDTGGVLAVLRGRLAVILLAERTALNLLSRASGVATHTRLWVDLLAGTGVQVLDTRKTTPGLRRLEKYAVRCGGGANKRMGLFDVAMVKDNHKIAAGSVTAAYAAVRERFPTAAVEVEVTTPDEAEAVVRAGARFLLCDNMSPQVLSEAVRRARAATEQPVELEATGGLTLTNAPAYAASGVEYLSVGALTHSSPILDIAVEVL